MYDLVVKKATLVCPDGVEKASLAVRGGKIAAIEPPGERLEGKRVVEAEGCYVLPGAIDSHVHFNDPGYTWREDFYHGSRAAAKGGITTVVDMPLQNLPPMSSVSVMQEKLGIIRDKSNVDYALWGAMLRDNREDLAGMQSAGVAAFKCFMCDPGKDYTDLQLTEIEDRLKLLKNFRGLAGFHCEDYQLLKEKEKQCLAQGRISRQDYLEVHSLEAEQKAVSDILQLAAKVDARVHICHVSHPEVAELIRQAKEKGIAVTAETCMHYLVFTEEDLLAHGAVFKCSPPLRTRDAAEALWEYVEDGTLDTICSDHSPCTLAEKGEAGPQGIFGAWGGLSGVQSMVQSCWDYMVERRKASPVLVAKRLAENPARIFGLYGRKGALIPGFDADFVILDPQREWTVETGELEYKNKFSAFAGQKGKGLPIASYLRGECIYSGQAFPAEPQGQFIPVMRGENV